ncbi:UNVERIFIED_CONTAM: putative 3-deoxy-D-manno-octulosonic acid transferase, mitochondrial [Sesamum radiatum]|uniref:3-deoxy-D-manno-octulosonic acid transferase, mitochondrial n=1 Tax=Sesamum radiatum TaxID=300843 RepID=A0AAW2R4V5_SESRA
MASKCGEAVYRIYRALTYGVSPLVRLHLRWRRFRGREHSLRWRERLGCPSASRPTGRLIWFHAVSLGEGLAAIPVIKCCLEMRPDVNVLMTTTTASAFEVIKNRLPSNVIYQSTIQGIHFQLLQAPPFIIHYPGDLKCAIADCDISEGDKKSLEEFQAQLSHRKVWMASSIHKGEEKGELRNFYRLTPIAVIGGSFLKGSAGHNIAEAAAAGCAVLTGHHVGHFSHMVAEMQRANPISVLQVVSWVVNPNFRVAMSQSRGLVCARNHEFLLSCPLLVLRHAPRFWKSTSINKQCCMDFL